MSRMIFEFLLLVKSELKRELLYLKRYPFETFSYIFFMYLVLMAIFLGISQLSLRGALEIDHDRMILGYCLMQFVMSSQMGWAGQISNESQTGTLEQLSISGHRLATVLLARGFAQFPRQTFSFFVLVGGYILSVPQVQISLEAFYRVIPVLFLIALGVYSVAYLFAGITLLFKRVGFFFQIINFAFLGLFWQDPTSLVKGSVADFLYHYFPLTLGMKNLTWFFNPENSFRWDLLWEQAWISAVFMAAGYLFFLAMESKAREKALLSQY